jgi:hypothetical protein
MMRAMLLAALLLVCCQTQYPGIYRNVTHYDYDLRTFKRTHGGVRYQAPAKDDTPAFRADLDRRTAAVKACLAKLNPAWVVRTDWFAVMVPPDWYVSTCSGEQLVPSKMGCQLCRDKGLVLADECCSLERPTAACPCVCNARAAIQDGGATKLIVTAPNLKLYAAELVRLVSYVNNPWTRKDLVACIRAAK